MQIVQMYSSTRTARLLLEHSVTTASEARA